LEIVADPYRYERVEIEGTDDIYEYAEQLKAADQRYDAHEVLESSEQY